MALRNFMSQFSLVPQSVRVSQCQRDYREWSGIGHVLDSADFALHSKFIILQMLK